MAPFDLIQQFVTEMKARFEFDHFNIYLSGNGPLLVKLEGEFTSEQLRLIAEELDRFSVEIAKLSSAI